MPVVAGYRIVRELASGSSGVVHLAIQESLGREVALKILSPGLFGAEETQARFLREAKVQASLSHPNLLRVFDAGFAGRSPYLAVELVMGGSLRERLELQGCLSLRESLGATGSIAAGLAYAHANGIIHRDLKPENALLTEDGQIKVADFGLAKVLASGQTVQTASGVILGTPGYIAPEVLRGEPAGPKADIYALGVILFECLCGRRPFEAETLGELLRAQQTSRAPAISAEIAGVPDSLDKLILACTEAGPGSRPTAGEMTEALARIESPKHKREPASSRVTAASKSRLEASEVKPRPSVGEATRRIDPRPTAPPGNATQVAEATAVRRTLLLPALVACAIALSAFALRPRSPAAPAKLAAVAATIPPRSITRPLVLERVTEGSAQAKVRLSDPARGGESLYYHARGSSSKQRKQFTAGDTEVSLAPLAPDTLYEAAAELGGKLEQFHFRTLPSNAVGQTLLSHPHGLGRGLTVLEVGDSLAAIWRVTPPKLEARVQFSESFDGGVTWTPIEELSRPDRECSWPSMTQDSRGLAAVWETGAGGQGVVEARYRPAGSHSWTPAAVFPASGAHEPALVVDSDGTFTLASWSSAGGSTAGLRITTFGWGGPTAAYGPPALSLPHFDNGLRCCTLARESKRIFCIYMVENDIAGFGHVLGAQITQTVGSGVQSMYAWRPDSASGAWKASLEWTDPNERVAATPDLVSFRGKLFACYQTEREVRIRSLDPAAVTLPGRWKLEGPVRIGVTPNLQIREGKLLLAYVSGSKPGGDFDRVVLETSEDGVGWSSAGSRPFPWDGDLLLRVAFWRGQPVFFSSDPRERLRALPR